MTSQRPWIPPPARTTRSNKQTAREDTLAFLLQNQTQPNVVLEAISQEINKLEGLVSSLDQLLNQQKDEALNTTQNDTDLEKERKHLCEIFSKLQTSQGEQRNLLQTILDQISITNTNLESASKRLFNSAKNEDFYKKQTLLLRSELEATERRYVRDVGFLKNSLLSQKMQSKESHHEWKALKKELIKKEDLIKNLVTLCDDLKLSMTEIGNEKLELEAIVQKLRKEVKSQHVASPLPKPERTDEISKLQKVKLILEDQMLKDKEKIAELRKSLSKLEKHSEVKMMSSQDIKRKIRKLEKHEAQYQKRLDFLERNVQNSVSAKSKKCSQVETCDIPVAVPDDSKNENSNIQNLKDILNQQEEQLSSLKDSLDKRNREIEELSKEKHTMQSHYMTEVSGLQSELHKALTANTYLQSHLQHLKNSYAAVFSDSSHTGDFPLHLDDSLN